MEELGFKLKRKEKKERYNAKVIFLMDRFFADKKASS